MSIEATACLMPPPPSLVAAPDLLSAVATAIESGDPRTARVALVAIDVEACATYWAECEQLRCTVRHDDKAHSYVGTREKGSVNADLRRRITARDGWRCRYCSLRVVDGVFFARLMRAVPDVFHDNVLESPNAICRIFTFVPDHVVPLAAGGPRDAEGNLVTSCGACNYPAKFSCLLDELGVEDPFTRAPVLDGWSGLRGRLPAFA